MSPTEWPARTEASRKQKMANLKRVPCQYCQHTIWGTETGPVLMASADHVVRHAQTRRAGRNSSYVAECPTCASKKSGPSRETAEEALRQHQLVHARKNIVMDVSMESVIYYADNVIVSAHPNSEPAREVRDLFFEPMDAVVFLTSDGGQRISELRKSSVEWPASVVCITTETGIFDDVPLDVDLSSTAMDVMYLPNDAGLGEVGAALSRALSMYASDAENLSIAIDMLPNIISAFEDETVFRFLYLLTERCQRAGATTHYYLDLEDQPEVTSQILREIVSVKVKQLGDAFVSIPV